MHPPHSYPSASLYVGDLASDVSEGHLFEIFNRVGPVALIRVCRDAATRARRSLGYAYVNYHNPLDAERALETLNNTLIRGRTCRIMWSQRDPSLRKSGIGNVFIKNLDKSVDHKQLYDLFSPHGNILSCKVALDGNNVSKGYGFVHFETQQQADNSITHINHSTINNKQVFVGPFIPRKQRTKADKFTNVFVKNLDENITDQNLKQLFSSYGPVTSSIVMMDHEGKSKCFGFVNFADHEHAAQAIEGLNGKHVSEGGKTLFVGKAQKKSDRDAELRQKYDHNRKPEYQGVNLYIKNLDEEVDDEKLKNEFLKFGTITSVKVMRDDKGASRGFGFVCFSRHDEAVRAVNEMKNNKLINNKPIQISLAQVKQRSHPHQQQQQQDPHHPNGRRVNHHNNNDYNRISGGHGAYANPNGAYQQQQQQQTPYKHSGPRGNRYSGGGHHQYNNNGGGQQQQQGSPYAGQNQRQPRSGGRRNFERKSGANPNAAAPSSPVPSSPAPAPVTDDSSSAATTTTPSSPAPASPAPAPAAGDSSSADASSSTTTTTPTSSAPSPAAADSSASSSPSSPGPVSSSADASSASATPSSTASSTAAWLADIPAEHHQAALGEKIYNHIHSSKPELAAKITGMLMERFKTVDELVALLEDQARLDVQVNEAVDVLNATPAESN